MRRILAVSAAACLLLAGCGSDGSSSSSGLGDVTVRGGDNPKLTVGKDFTTGSTETRVVTKGSGEKLADGDSVKVNYVAVNGRTGKQFDNSFTSKSPLTLTLDDTSALPGFLKGLSGQNVGSRVLVAIPPKDGFGQARTELGIKADDTMLFLFDIVAKVPEKATGASKKLPATVPSIVEKDGHPDGFEPTKKTPDKVSEATAHVVIEGDGPEVEKGQTITSQYIGQVYPDGEVFDSSWTKGDARRRSRSTRSSSAGRTSSRARRSAAASCSSARPTPPTVTRHRRAARSSPATRWCLPSTCSTHPDILLPWPSARPRG